ncbi:MAG: septal ring lytic transglycosylase RlpA family protein [Saprospiraceae bacterium]
MKTYFKLTLSMFLLFGLTVAMTAQDDQYGQASYYSDAYHGKKTASGAKYDKNKMTCAHNDYAYGTMLKVTHLENKKSVVVKVIDRGPYIKGRIVDLSRAAASKIGLIQDGIAQVKIELVKTKSDELTSKGAKKPDEYSPPTNTRRSVEETIKKGNARATDASKSTSKVPVATKKTAPKKDVVAPKPAPTTSSKGAAKMALPMMNASDFKNAELFQISILKPRKEGFGVQVASLSDYDGVLKKVAELQGKWFSNILVSTEKVDRGNNVYKIILGQFETREQANSYKKDLKKNKRISGFVIALGDKDAK